VRSFAVTWDYRCPFTRNFHLGVIAGLRAGTGWDVSFRPFNLDHAYADGGDVTKGNAAEREPGLLPLSWGVAVRDRWPDRFIDFHEAVFAARFDSEQEIDREEVLRVVAKSVSIDDDAVAAEVASGGPAETVEAEHNGAVRESQAFGVPTVLMGSRAVFVRLLDPATPEDVEHILLLMEWRSLNELKHAHLV
jgi:hypothetical protein